MKNKRILAFTSIRSDYDLMSPLYKLLHNDPNMEFKILVSGAHLSETYGCSVDLIKQDGFDILSEIETLIDSNSRRSRLKSASLLLQNMIDVVSQYNPDLILYAGDREDALMCATLGGYLAIPTVHFYGGDHSQDGYIDNTVRHSISKLSTFHIVSTEEHKQRLLKMGESVSRIVVTGSVALDNFIQEAKGTVKEIMGVFKISKDIRDYAILIFHPILNDYAQSEQIFTNILDVLSEQKIKTFVSYPNTDPGNKKIIEVINKYIKNDNFVFYKNLERAVFIKLFKNASFIIGNSSAGILEAASIPIPTINVGKRQIGRYAGKNVVFSAIDIKAIENSILKATSVEFLQNIIDMKNPYGNGMSAAKAYEIIVNTDFGELLLKTEDPLNG